MAGGPEQDTPNDHAALAREAFERAQDEAAGGDAAAARRWLERATRLAPHDQTLALALATAYLAHDDQDAAARFASLAAAHDVREVWSGLATARRRIGDVPGAAAAIAEALARHVPDHSLTALATVIAREAGKPGWCALAGDGVVTVHAGVATRCQLDGKDVRLRSFRLPPNWRDARWLTVTAADGRHLLGSPIDIRAITRIVGCVAGCDGGVEGWAWQPGDPDADPMLTIEPAVGSKRIRLVATDHSVQVADSGLLARPRGFRVPAAKLAGFAGKLHIRGADGRDLLGSPLDPGSEQRVGAAAAMALAQQYPAAKRARRQHIVAAVPALPVDAVAPCPPIGVSRRRRSVDIVVPVYGGAALTLACLDSVLADLPPSCRLIVVDDASPDPALRSALDALAARRKIVLHRNRHNLGFPASANVGLTAAAGHDVVLLNSDTLVAPGWLRDLRDVAYSAANIGTVTPLSNDATILSYPGPAGRNDRPDMAQTRQLAALARRVNHGSVVDIPVGVGFCLYIRRDCLDAVGLLRADVFAQGYGEENDFCLRARHLGWRHVAAPGVFVAHVGGHSFGAAARHLQARNAALLTRLHPGYDALIAAFAAADPLAPVRRKLDLARWRAARHRGTETVLLITHDAGGGVERQIAAAVTRHQAAGRRVIVLRPARSPDGSKAVLVCDGMTDAFPNLRYALPDELPALIRLLAGERPQLVELHHMVGHHPAILELIGALGTRYEVHVHDYAWLCGRGALVGPDQRYCGEPAVARCEACVADGGNLIDEDISVAALRQRSAGLFAAASAVLTPSQDTATRISRHFPGITPRAVAHEDDAAAGEPAVPATINGRCRVCIIGAIGIHKGYQVVLECARDAAERELRLDFVIVGHTIDDRRLLATRRVFITGSYASDEAERLIRQQRASLALLPSICPETWSFSLTEAWRAGLRVAAFDIGAPAERIRRSGRGFLLPLGLPANAINNALIAAAGLSGPE